MNQIKKAMLKVLCFFGIHWSGVNDLGMGDCLLCDHCKAKGYNLIVLFSRPSPSIAPQSVYEKHAWREFKAAGWLDENGEFKDRLQKLICEHVLRLLKEFDNEGHSGSTAPYAIGLFKELASFEPIVPIQGTDDEWVSVGTGVLQNNRCGHIFKSDDRFMGQAYDAEAIIFYDVMQHGEDGAEYKSYYSCGESAQPITFPYTPKKEYRERPVVPL